MFYRKVFCKRSVEDINGKDQNIRVSRILLLLVVVATTSTETHSRNRVIAIERQYE